MSMPLTDQHTTVYIIFLIACGNCATILRKRAAVHSEGHGRWFTPGTTRYALCSDATVGCYLPSLAIRCASRDTLRRAALR